MNKVFCSWLNWVVSFSWCWTVFPAPRWAQTTRSRTHRGLKRKWTHPYQRHCIRVPLALDRRGNHTRWVQRREGQRFRFRWVREENKSYFSAWYPHELSPRNSGWSSPSSRTQRQLSSASKGSVLHVAPPAETEIKRLPEAFPLLVFSGDLVDSLICWLALVSVVFSL